MHLLIYVKTQSLHGLFEGENVDNSELSFIIVVGSFNYLLWDEIFDPEIHLSILELSKTTSCISYDFRVRIKKLWLKTCYSGIIWRLLKHSFTTIRTHFLFKVVIDHLKGANCDDLTRFETFIGNNMSHAQQRLFINIVPAQEENVIVYTNMTTEGVNDFVMHHFCVESQLELQRIFYRLQQSPVSLYHSSEKPNNTEFYTWHLCIMKNLKKCPACLGFINGILNPLNNLCSSSEKLQQSMILKVICKHLAKQVIKLFYELASIERNFKDELEFCYVLVKCYTVTPLFIDGFIFQEIVHLDGPLTSSLVIVHVDSEDTNSAM
ncbi:hypothetical protein LIER_06131 [Lithospermum erythrorhizon]|uniref:Uncharacterized protein n=1 Tax=Lithospermum erythrorhizon TaxID=34254 RepID=A0AAV3P440_LITER